MVVGANTFWIDAIILVSSFVPIIIFCFFAVWFLRRKGD
jgi:hypothetical protein